MKKLFLVPCSIVLLVLLVVFGPDLLDLYRLDRYIASSADASQAEQGAWPALADVCIGCHGFSGNSQHHGYPSLAGQPAPYVAAQLHRFAVGQRADPTMGPMAMTLKETEIDLLANHFQGQRVDQNRSFEPDPGSLEKGKQLVSAGSCVACHGERLMGHDQFPRLAGQGYDYLVAQLDAFASGARADATGAMKGVAQSVSAEERKAIASYLASLVPERK